MQALHTPPEFHTPPAEHDELASNSDTDISDAKPLALLSSPTAGKQKPAAAATQQIQGASKAFVNIISSKIEELEKSMGGTGTSQAEKDTLKARKKQLREVVKYLGDKANSMDDRMAFVQTKYTAAVQELLKQDKQLRETQTQLELTTKDRDKAQEGLRRTNMLRDKLEELCRQLQKENKEVLEEARRVRDEELAARAAQQARLQAAISEVTEKVEAQAAERQAQITENDTLRTKLGEVLAQMETFNELVNKKDLETQLANARLEQQAAVCDALTKKNELLEEANTQLHKAHQSAIDELQNYLECQKANVVLTAANKELKEQLEQSYARYNEFQTTLTKSNQMFEKFRKDIEANTRHCQTLTKDRDKFKRLVEEAGQTITQLSQRNTDLTSQVSTLQSQLSAVEGVDAEEVKRLKGQKEALEGLCRTLTAQLKQAKAGGSAATAAAEPAQSEGDAGGSAAQAGAQAEGGRPVVVVGGVGERGRSVDGRQTGDSDCLSPVLPLPPPAAMPQ